MKQHIDAKILRRPGIEPGPPAWKAGILTTILTALGIGRPDCTRNEKFSKFNKVIQMIFLYFTRYVISQIVQEIRIKPI